MVTRMDMTNIDPATASQPKTKTKKKLQKREAWRRYAERRGVSTRTLDRWAAAGIIPSPEYVRGRKYIDPEVAPRQDDAA